MTLSSRHKHIPDAPSAPPWHVNRVAYRNLIRPAVHATIAGFHDRAVLLGAPPSDAWVDRVCDIAARAHVGGGDPGKIIRSHVGRWMSRHALWPPYGFQGDDPCDGVDGWRWARA